MDRVKIFRLFAALTVLCCTSSLAQERPTRIHSYIADQLLNNVVVIEASDQSDMHLDVGLGMILGRSGPTLWIATAAHVVFPAAEGADIMPLQPARRIRVKLRDGRRVDAMSAPDKAFGADLAFIAVRLPLDAAGPDTWRESVAIDSPQAGTAVRIAGVPNEIRYGQPGGIVKSRTPTGEILVEGLVGELGQSGGPVATSDGFIGMYVQSAGQRIIPMKTIRDAALAANHPFQLIPPLTRVPVTLCLVNDGGDDYRPRINGGSGIMKLPSDGCIKTMSGTNLLVSEAGIQCKPARLDLSAADTQTVHYTCTTDPAGVWNSPTDGYLAVKHIGENLWEIKGLDMSPFGKLEGHLHGRPPNLQVELNNAYGIAISGMVMLNPNRINGKLMGGGTFYTLDVTR